MARRKKRRKLKSGVAKVFSALMILCVLAVTALFLPCFNITNIVVEGNAVLKSEEIIKVSQTGRGYNLFRTSTGKAKKNILKLPYIKDVKIKRVLPASLKIIVSEEDAAAYVVNGKNFVAINKEGRVLEVSKKTRDGIMKMPGLKVLESEPGEIIKYKSSVTKEIQDLCMEKLFENELLKKSTLLDISNISSIKIEFDNGLLAQLGTSDEIDYKIKMIDTVLKQGYGSGIFNIENTAQPTYRKNE